MKKLLFCAIILFPGFFLAQPATPPPVTLETPYNSAYVHLYYLQNDSYRPGEAAKVIYGVADSARAAKLAIRLKQILDGKGLYVQLNQIPSNANYWDSTLQKPYYFLFPGKLPEVYLEKIEGLWYYSRETVAAIPRLHREVYPWGSDILVSWLAQFGDDRFLGLAVWQYIGLGFLLLLIFLLHQLFTRLLNPVLRWFSRSRFRFGLVDPKLIRSIARLVSILIILRLLRIFLPPLQLPVRLIEFLFVGIEIASILLIVLILLRIIDVVVGYGQRFTETTESKMDEQLLPIIRRTLQAIIIIGGTLQMLRLLDVNVTALIAGISIGGLALALAAQDTVKNLIGSAAIFVDQPFQIGDWIEGSGFAGTVVEVGFRTTRIQGIDTSIISVPNGNLANMSVTNLGVRKMRLFKTNLGVLYSTPPDLIEKFLEGLKEIIVAHPKTNKEAYYIHLNSLGDSSLNILFRTYLEVPSYGDELIAKEEILFDVLRLAERLDVGFAFPSTSLYVEAMPPHKNE